MMGQFLLDNFIYNLNYIYLYISDKTPRYTTVNFISQKYNIQITIHL